MRVLTKDFKRNKLINAIIEDERVYCFDRTYCDDETWAEQNPNKSRFEAFKEFAEWIRGRSINQILAYYDDQYDHLLVDGEWE